MVTKARLIFIVFPCHGFGFRSSYSYYTKLVRIKRGHGMEERYKTSLLQNPSLLNFPNLLDSDSRAFLTFTSKLQYTSEPIRIAFASDSDNEKILLDGVFNANTTTTLNRSLRLTYKILQEYFQKSESRNRIFSGSGNMSVKKQTIPKTHDGEMYLDRLNARWDDELLYFKQRDWIDLKHSKVAIEDENDSQNSIHACVIEKNIVELRVRTSFLVFTIHAIATLGEKLYGGYGHDINYLPKYQFVLLCEDFEAEGPPPLVWIFNQLTGKGSKKPPLLSSVKENTPHLFHAFLDVIPEISYRREDDSVIENLNDVDEVHQMEVKFHASTGAEISISFPAALLQILPVPKERIERQGNTALAQNMKRDVIPGIDKFRNAFVEYYKSRSRRHA